MTAGARAMSLALAQNALCHEKKSDTKRIVALRFDDGFKKSSIRRAENEEETVSDWFTLAGSLRVRG